MDFKKLKEMWIENKQVSDEDMLNWMYSTDNPDIVISWSLIDKNGELLKFPTDTDEITMDSIRENLENNINSLLELPYPREIIKYSVMVGKDTQYDSPRYCNFFCEWIKRKIMNKFMYTEVCQYIQKIKLFFNGRENNKYLIADLVSLKYGHMYTLYQIYKSQ